MKNKHLLFAVALVLTAGLTGFSQTAGQGQLELTADSGKKVQDDGPNNPENYMKSRRVNQKTGTINIADIVRAQAQVRELTQKGTNSFNMAWDELGPNNSGGRTRSILIDKDDSGLIYAGSVGGGFWKSTTRGTSWTKSVTTDGSLFENQVITAMTQASNGDIYIGTGEGLARGLGNPNNQYFGVNGQGIYKSTDRGNTFQRLNATWKDAAAQETFIWVNAICADPTNANKIYAATRMGLRVSNDAGASWTNPLPGLDSVAQDVEVASDGTVFASIYNIAYKSTDGTNFVKISDPDGVEVGLIMESANTTRLKFACAPSNANMVYCVAVGLGTNSQLENIYQSKDKGETWSVIGPGGASSFQPFGTYGDYNIAIAVDPQDENFIMVGGANMFSWSYETGWERITLDEPGGVMGLLGYYVHINQHDIAWSTTDSNTIYIGTNGGVAATTNKGYSWIVANRNYNVTQFFTIAFSNKGEVLGGSLDNGTRYIDYQGNDPMYANWWGGGVFSSFKSFRHGGDVAISMVDSNIKFFTTPGGTLHRRVVAEGQVTTRQNYYGYANGGAFISPIALWESWNDPKSWDSINYIAERDYAAGETLIVESALGKRPLKKVLEVGLVMGDTVKIHDTYQAMIAVGKNDGAGVKINRGAINMSESTDVQRWHTVIDRKLLEDKTGESNTGNQVIEITFSNDGNHMYTAVWHRDDAVYKIFRVSNLENARSRSTMNTTTGYNPITGERTYVETTTEIGQFTQIPTSIVVHPTNPDVVLITLGNYGNDNYLYLATAATQAADSTMAFSPVAGNLPQAPIYTAMFNARDYNEVLVGTEFGVYSTPNIMAATTVWSSENGNGMEIVPVMDLKQQLLENNAERGIENSGVVYAATFGRGFWKSETFASKGSTGAKYFANPASLIEVSVMPNPVVDIAQLSYSVASNTDVEFEIYDLTGKMVKQINVNNQIAGKHQLSIDANEFKSGAYLIRMTANGQQSTTKFMVR